MIKKMLAAVVLLATVMPLQPVTVQTASKSRTAFWIRDGKPFVGHATERDGKIRLNRFDDWVNIDPLEGEVLSVTWSPDGRAVSWYDAGQGRYVVVNNAVFVNPNWVTVPADQVEDRGGWLWASEGEIRQGQLAMFDPNSEATTAERWKLINARDVDDLGEGTAAPSKFKASGRDVSSFVTAVVARRVIGGVVAVRPYSVVNGERQYRTAYLARVTNSLAVGRKIGSTLPVFNMAMSAGNSRIAIVTGADRRVQIRSFPDLKVIKTYPGMRKAHVSLSPDGFLAISGPDRTIIRDDDGTQLEVPEGITWFAYAPCSGKGCGELA